MMAPTKTMLKRSWRMPRASFAVISTGAAVAATLLAGCTIDSRKGSIGEQLGFAVGSPDAFMIISREPLQMPPSLQSLPTPQPGETSPRMPDAYAEARQSLFGSPDQLPTTSATTQGQEALLASAGANVDNSAARAALDAETAANADTERRFGLTSFLGIPIPANLEDRDAALQSQEENLALREQGLPTPTAPPIAEEPEGGVQFDRNYMERRR